MTESLYSLVARLEAEGHVSTYLDRLRAHLRPTGSVGESRDPESIEAELRAEAASALGRAGAKVDVLLLRLELLGAQLAQDPSPEAIESFHRLRLEALEARRDLMIHREALGIRDNSSVVDHYPIPASWEGKG